jgi:hypothetical protein
MDDRKLVFFSDFHRRDALERDVSGDGLRHAVVVVERVVVRLDVGRNHQRHDQVDDG